MIGADDIHAAIDPRGTLPLGPLLLYTTKLAPTQRGRLQLAQRLFEMARLKFVALIPLDTSLTALAPISRPTAREPTINAAWNKSANVAAASAESAEVPATDRRMAPAMLW